jgi:hypothetical protein
MLDEFGDDPHNAKPENDLNTNMKRRAMVEAWLIEENKYMEARVKSREPKCKPCNVPEE